MTFHGETYEPEHDEARLKTQFERVRYILMCRPGQKWTLAGLAISAGGGQTAVSARIRELRRLEGLNIQKERAAPGSGTWLYWYEPPKLTERSEFLSEERW